MTAETEQSVTRENRLRGRLLIVAAALMWSASGFFAKAPLFDSWPLEHRGPLLAFWRSLFAAAVLLPFVRRLTWKPRLMPMLFIFAAMNYCYLTAMTLTTAANAIWLQNTAPAWVLLFGVLWLREPVTSRDWIMLAFALSGVGFILVFEVQGETPVGVAYGLLSGVFYAGVVLSIRWLRAEDPVWLIALNHTVTALVLTPYVIWYGVWPAGEQWLYLAFFGPLQIGIPYVLFARGLRSIAGHEASAIALLEPILVPVWVFLAWRSAPSYSPPQWWTIAGGMLILVGLAVRYRSVGWTLKTRKDRQPDGHRRTSTPEE